MMQIEGDAMWWGDALHYRDFCDPTVPTNIEDSETWPIVARPTVVQVLRVSVLFVGPGRRSRSTNYVIAACGWLRPDRPGRRLFVCDHFALTLLLHFSSPDRHKSVPVPSLVRRDGLDS